MKRSLPSRPCGSGYLIEQGPAQVLEVAVLEEALWVGPQPQAQLLDAHGPDVRHAVAVAVHKHPPHRRVDKRPHILSVFQQLVPKTWQHTNPHVRTQKSSITPFLTLSV